MDFIEQLPQSSDFTATLVIVDQLSHGTEFISHFFWSLGKALDMCLHFTSSHHPEGDGQTERSNQTLEQYLHIYSNINPLLVIIMDYLSI